MKKLIARFVREEEGQDLVEYALLLALIALVTVTAVTTLGQTVKGKYENMNTAFPAAPAS